MCFTILVNTSKLMYMYKHDKLLQLNHLKCTLGKMFNLALL